MVLAEGFTAIKPGRLGSLAPHFGANCPLLVPKQKGVNRLTLRSITLTTATRDTSMSKQDATSTESHTSQTTRPAWQSSVQRLSTTAKPGHYDELHLPGGELRPVWSEFFESIGVDAIRRLPLCNETVDSVIAQNGITYNVFADKQEQARPWSLNPLPMIIEASEWSYLSTSLAQRARLLNGIVQDVYHDRTLLKAAYLPSALVLGNPGYLPAMHRVNVPGDVYLQIVAFDLARDPDGQWWVIGQRTQSPSGLGYVLENRLIVSRLFPQAYRDMRIQHLASSYRELLASLESQARQAMNEPPRFALLSSGPYSETYFEHAYLARYLGLPLVEGPDLTVRDERLFLKTVHGLQRIHGLVRRLDDDFCDPLELRTDSTLGVPGLLQAIRAGNVIMANSLGTGFLESPAIQGFLPSICEHLLDEPLMMPSLHTWWCGETAAWQDVSPRLDTQVIKPTFANRQSTNFEPIIASLLSDKERDQWRKKISRQPDIYTTQTYLPFSQVPTLRGQTIEPRTAMMRFYAMHGADGQWHVMPGGMTRVAAVDPHIVSIRSGGSTLDTWVMSDDDVDTFSMLPKRAQIKRWRAQDELVSSRSAENLFWLGRYTERAESMVRLARETLVLLSTDRRESQPALNEAITALARHQSLVPFDSPSMAGSPERFGDLVVSHMLGAGTGGLLDVINALQTAMRSVRDRLPADHVEIPARIRSLLANDGDRSDMTQALDQVELPLAALVGYQLDRMTKDLGWRLLSTGRLLERLINQSQIIEQFFQSAAVFTPQGFDSLLVLFDSAITYRTRYQRQQDIAALLDLLVMDDTNPRAISRTLYKFAEQLRYLPDHSDLIDALPSLEWQDDNGSNLLGQVSQVALTAGWVSDEISRRFFAHVSEQSFAS